MNCIEDATTSPTQREVFTTHFTIKKAQIAPGKYRKITGNEATAIGFVAASQLAGRDLFYGSYPITPASDILHELARHKSFGVKTFQAEDEIAAVCSAIGASFAGQIGLTGTSGPGVALKQEAIGLAVMTELPLVISRAARWPINRLADKTDKRIYSRRSGDATVNVRQSSSPRTPADVSHGDRAVRSCVQIHDSGLLSSDGYLWRMARSHGPCPRSPTSPKIEFPFVHRTDWLHALRARNPGTLARALMQFRQPGLEHRIGGIEKPITGNVNYTRKPPPDGKLRQENSNRVANGIPLVEVFW